MHRTGLELPAAGAPVLRGHHRLLDGNSRQGAPEPHRGIGDDLEAPAALAEAAVDERLVREPHVQPHERRVVPPRAEAEDQHGRLAKLPHLLHQVARRRGRPPERGRPPQLPVDVQGQRHRGDQERQRAQGLHGRTPGHGAVEDALARRVLHALARRLEGRDRVERQEAQEQDELHGHGGRPRVLSDPGAQEGLASRRLTVQQPLALFRPWPADRAAPLRPQARRELRGVGHGAGPQAGGGAREARRGACGQGGHQEAREGELQPAAPGPLAIASAEHLFPAKAQQRHHRPDDGELQGQRRAVVHALQHLRGQRQRQRQGGEAQRRREAAGLLQPRGPAPVGGHRAASERRDLQPHRQRQHRLAPHDFWQRGHPVDRRAPDHAPHPQVQDRARPRAARDGPQRGRQGQAHGAAREAGRSQARAFRGRRAQELQRHELRGELGDPIVLQGQPGREGHGVARQQRGKQLDDGRPAAARRVAQRGEQQGNLRRGPRWPGSWQEAQEHRERELHRLCKPDRRRDFRALDAVQPERRLSHAPMYAQREDQR
mmetsp:Transcript_97229/g.271479  ORF Transcript_97229/g.271479 Transcript_97229/m.271479 type:complete len:546 (-) Transcript_97229:63-1700(-)